MSPARHKLISVAIFAVGLCPFAAVSEGGVIAVPSVLEETRQQTSTRLAALQALGEGVTLRYGDYGLIHHIEGDLPFVLESDDGTTKGDRAFFENLRVLLGLFGEERFGDLNTVPVGTLSTPRHFRAPQFIAGIPVIGASIVLRTSSDGAVQGVRARLLRDRDLPRSARASEFHAGMNALAAVEEELSSGGIKDRQLVYYMTSKSTGALAWEFKIQDLSELEFPRSFEVYIDAITGELLGYWPLELSGKNRYVYNSNNTTTLSYGSPVCSEGYGCIYWDDSSAVYNFSGDTYEYFSQSFGRDSFDGAGGTINSSVRYGANIANAFWSNQYDWMIFGDGDGGAYGPFGYSRDVVVHELAHGVTKYSVNLPYQGESGAINEVFSDIHAAAADAFHNGVSAATWRIAEDVYYPAYPTYALRYMNDPAYDYSSRDNWPNRYTGTEDFGGVHWNSGIGNLAFYLLSQGGTHPRGVTSNSVTGVGIAKARAIFYYSMPYLPGGQTTDFEDLRDAAASAALSLYGSSEVTSVHAAFDAVLVPGGSGAPTQPATISVFPGYCYGNQSVSWSSASGATSYQLRFSTGSDVSSGTLLYSGASTGTHWINVPDSGYVGVAACNANGCSAYQSTNVTYYPSCA